MHNWMGWVATALFALSYFSKQAVRMRLLQALAALVWIAYGIRLQAPPVIVANLIVAALASYSAWKESRPAQSD